jgi:hypothetical protein
MKKSPPYLAIDNEADQAEALETWAKARLAPLHACFDKLDTALATRLEPFRERIVSIDARREQEENIAVAFLEMLNCFKSDPDAVYLLMGNKTPAFMSLITEMHDNWTNDDYWDYLEYKESENAQR